MAIKKERERELKNPDQFQVLSARFISWLSKNAVTLTAVIVPLVLVLIGGVVWQVWSDSRGEDRQVALAKVRAVFAQETKNATEKRQKISDEIREIDKKLSDLKKKPAAGQDDASKTGDAAQAQLTAQKTALTEKRDQVQADHNQSRDQFHEFFKSNDGNPEGWAAGMTAAKLYLDDKQLDVAKGILETTLRNSLSNKFYQVHARLVYINVLEEQNQFDAGLKEVATLLSVVGDELKPQVMLTKGRLQLLNNAKDEAHKTFSELIEKHENSAEAQKARSIKALYN